MFTISCFLFGIDLLDFFVFDRMVLVSRAVILGGF